MRKYLFLQTHLVADGQDLGMENCFLTARQNPFRSSGCYRMLKEKCTTLGFCKRFKAFLHAVERAAWKKGLRKERVKEQ
jgi:hypothetical protein